MKIHHPMITLAGITIAGILFGQHAPKIGNHVGQFPQVVDLSKVLESQSMIPKVPPYWLGPRKAHELGIQQAVVTPAKLENLGNPAALVKPVNIASLESPKPIHSVSSLISSSPVSGIASPGPSPDPTDLAGTVWDVGIQEVEVVTQPDQFSINREFNWDKPYGNWMNQMLKDIDAAKKTGDTERYTSLTERYSAWAEKYLRRDDPPNLDGTPGR